MAESIIKQRIKKKMTQSEVAQKTGIQQSTVAKIEGMTHGLLKLPPSKKPQMNRFSGFQ